MIEKTDGYILRKTIFRNTSYILDILTERFGRMSFMAKGARGEKSPFLGTLEVFSKISVVFRYNEMAEIQTMRSADLITDSFYITQRLASFEQVGEIAALIRRMVPEREPHADIFAAFDIMMKGIKQEKDAKAVMYFLVKMAEALGWPFSVEQRCACGGGEALTYFNPNMGAFSCERCRNGIYSGDLHAFIDSLQQGDARTFVMTPEEFTHYYKIIVDYFSIHTR